jgi:hypothetical protein
MFVANEIKITVAVSAIYTPLVSAVPVSQHIFALGALVHVLYNCLGIWSLGKYGLRFIWATPVTLHGFVLILAVWLFVQAHPWAPRQANLQHRPFYRLLSLVAVHLILLMLSIIGMVQDWEAQFLVQCLLCMVGNLEYLLWNFVSERCGARAIADSVL